MAGTTSEIKLASNALILLGHQPISSFTEATAGAQVASNLFEDSYRSYLSIHRWRFASKQCDLSRLSAKPNNTYQYQHQLPIDMVYLIRTVPASDFEVYGDKLYSNQPAVTVEYVQNIDASSVPSYWAKSFESYLASQFAIPITGDIEKASYFAQLAERQLVRAKHIDSSQRPNDAFEDSPYVDVRS